MKKRGKASGQGSHTYIGQKTKLCDLGRDAALFPGRGEQGKQGLERKAGAILQALDHVEDSSVIHGNPWKGFQEGGSLIRISLEGIMPAGMQRA